MRYGLMGSFGVENFKHLEHPVFRGGGARASHCEPNACAERARSLCKQKLASHVRVDNVRKPHDLTNSGGAEYSHGMIAADSLR